MLTQNPEEKKPKEETGKHQVVWNHQERSLRQHVSKAAKPGEWCVRKPEGRGQAIN